MTTTVKSSPTLVRTQTSSPQAVDDSAEPIASPVVAPSADETTDVKKPVPSTTQTGARQRATSAEAAMRARLDNKIDGQADAVAALKEHHPLAQGDDSPEVQPETKQLQQFLKDKGLYSGDVTGKFDAATDKAVRAFQQQNGLKVDGIVGQQTWGAVLGVKADPGINMLQPWAHSFTHASGGAGAVATSPDGATLRDKAKS
ncbi:MAG TPA: peptidoglycan-binding domain-containing protein, partial [Myxococcota bacterium]